MEDGFARLTMKQIIGRARVKNTASIHVFDKLGMQFVEEFVEDGENWVLYKKEIGKMEHTSNEQLFCNKRWTWRWKNHTD